MPMINKYGRRVISFKLRYIFFILLVVAVFFYESIIELSRIDAKKESNVPMKLPYVAVHIDLKGAPPKLDYLSRLLPMLRGLGVNVLVMEYEDMFPFSGSLQFLRARNCYTKSELQTFLRSAVNLGFELIPLVQTFGHLEYALKFQKTRHLRESTRFPDSICPTHFDSRIYLTSILKQVIEFHNKVAPVKHIHVGCDEVFHINKCEKCRQKNLSNIDLYLDHVEFITKTITSMSPNTSVMIWHDMLRSKKPIQNRNYRFPKTDVVYWKYNAEDPDHMDLFNLHKEFKNIWIATAFKGADGRISILPDIEKRFQNHVRMLKSMVNYKFAGELAVHEFKGIILTGWSRYSHNDPLCDILQGSLSSLVTNLLLVKNVKQGICNINEIDNHNSFIRDYAGEVINKYTCKNANEVGLSKCDFDGTKLIDGFKLLIKIKEEVKFKYFDVEAGLQSVDFYVNLNVTNKNNVQDHTDWCLKVLIELEQIKKAITFELFLNYSSDTINEFLGLHTNYETNLLKKLLTNLNKLSNVET